MTDPAVTPTPTPAAVPAAAPIVPATPTAFDYTKAIGADGKFQDGWKAGLPEDIRGEICLDTAPDLPELAKQYVNAQKMIGKNKVVLPTDKSTPAEIEAFRLATGVPKTPGEYKITPPTDLTLVDLAPDAIAPVLAEFHKAGLNQKQTEVAFKQFEGFIRKLEESVQVDEQARFEAAEKMITEESGEALEDQKHYANLFIEQECPDETKRAALLEALNSNSLRPYVFNLLANTYRKYCAPAGGIPAPQGGTAMTPAMLEAKAQELMATPGYIDGSMKDTNPAGFNRLTQEITELYNKSAKASIQKG